MTDKSGGDALQANQGMQGNLSAQDANSIATGGVGAVDGMGGTGMSMGDAMQNVTQDQMQANMASTGGGGGDNVNADTNITT